MPMNDTQLDLLALARTAAKTGQLDARRAVLKLTRKHAGTELGQHLGLVCREAGIPVPAPPSAGEPSVMDSPHVLKASEVMDRLVVLASGDSARLSDYRLAFDFILGDFGAKVVKQQLEILVGRGAIEAAEAIAELVAQDERKSYAVVGRRFMVSLAKTTSSGS
ncbi:hypothetical protein [Ottowia sp.]|uniref:hypothetical protein n=1 Tax=Ottowia sp. TaxID=1898956 RepID=UPI0025F158EE|nr:hypothetical protein [Ottowia sp.]MBK6616160.1 hypothetical protein [Ottowia sp.]